MRAGKGEECIAYANRGTRAWILIATLANVSCSVYSNPSVDLVLHVSTVDASREVGLVISQFAQRKQLIASSAVNDDPAPEWIRRLNEKTTHYVTGTPHGKGRSLTFLDASPTCKVIQVVELSANWNAQSQADLDELRAALSAIEGVAVELGAKFEPGTNSGRGINEYCSSSMQ